MKKGIVSSKFQEPKLKNLEPKKISDSDTLENLSYGIYQDSRIHRDFQEEEIDSVIFQNIHFQDCTFERVEWIDVLFDNCDLSNLHFDNNLFTRVIFKNCKMMGTTFVDASFENVKWSSCNASYSNFASSIFFNGWIEKSNFNDTNFSMIKIHQFHLEDVTLRNSEWLETSLKDIDFSKADISSCHFDLSSVKGMIIDSSQAMFLVGMLDVKVKE